MKKRLRINKKQAIINQIKRENPDLPPVYVQKEVYKIANKDYYNTKAILHEGRNTTLSTAWLHERGIKKCSICRSWDLADNKWKLCPTCINEREQHAQVKLEKLFKKTFPEHEKSEIINSGETRNGSCAAT